MKLMKNKIEKESGQKYAIDKREADWKVSILDVNKPVAKAKAESFTSQVAHEYALFSGFL